MEGLNKGECSKVYFTLVSNVQGGINEILSKRLAKKSYLFLIFLPPQYG